MIMYCYCVVVVHEVDKVAAVSVAFVSFVLSYDVDAAAVARAGSRRRVDRSAKIYTYVWPKIRFLLA